MTLTLFDFEGEQITQITSHLLGDGLRGERERGRGKAPHFPTPPLVLPNVTQRSWKFSQPMTTLLANPVQYSAQR